MAHWLYKSEPAAWSWEAQKAAGAAGTAWTGVRNYQARNFMRAMQIGDRGFFYHSNEGLAVVGIVEVCALSHRIPPPRIRAGTASTSAPSRTCHAR